MQINNVLLINPSYYSCKQEDIEHLYYSDNITNLVKAAEKCEKFHSYFHYEESFFYTMFSNLVPSHQKQEFLEKAIHLSPVNKSALIMLQQINSSKTNKLQLKLSHIEKFSDNLLRPYKTFLRYMQFATENNTLQSVDVIHSDNYWVLYEEFDHKQDIEILEKAMKDLKERHVLYHKEAANIYYALYLLARSNDLLDLARFAITKAMNLNPEIQKND
jgi:tetratricopeptide (TPR) repeat protein